MNNKFDEQNDTVKFQLVELNNQSLKGKCIMTKE